MPGDAQIIERLSPDVNGARAHSDIFFRESPSCALLQFARQILLALLVVSAAAIGATTAANEAPKWAVAVMPKGEEFSLEIAADDASRQKGYMFREKIGDREGMLFLFDAMERHSFWMKNCRIHLDILWLDASFRIVDVAADLAPCPEHGDCPSVLPVEPARYVLEIAGGAAKRLGLTRGDRIVVLTDPPLR